MFFPVIFSYHQTCEIEREKKLSQGGRYDRGAWSVTAGHRHGWFLKAREAASDHQTGMAATRHREAGDACRPAGGQAAAARVGFQSRPVSARGLATHGAHLARSKRSAPAHALLPGGPGPRITVLPTLAFAFAPPTGSPPGRLGVSKVPGRVAASRSWT